MGKTKQKHASKTQPPKSEKPASHPTKVTKSKILHSTEKPKEYLPAAHLTADQKHIVKKKCQNLYNYKHSEKRVTTIETATNQLEQMMQTKALQLKLKKKQQPHIQNVPI